MHSKEELNTYHSIGISVRAGITYAIDESFSVIEDAPRSIGQTHLAVCFNTTR